MVWFKLVHLLLVDGQDHGQDHGVVQAILPHGAAQVRLDSPHGGE